MKIHSCFVALNWEMDNTLKHLTKIARLIPRSSPCTVIGIGPNFCYNKNNILATLGRIFSAFTTNFHILVSTGRGWLGMRQE